MPHCDVRTVHHAPHTNTAKLNEARKQGRWTGDQHTILDRQHHPVVRHKLGGRQGAGGVEDEAQRERGFSGTRRPPDEEPNIPHGDATGVEGGRRVRGHGQPAGRRTMKRAPVTWGVPSGSVTVRFSAQMRPPWASTICREMERPRPEFWPKP